jgi:hypothetical protein
MVVEVNKAWERGHETWQKHPKMEEFQLVIDAIKQQLNEITTITKLTEKYYGNNDWCIKLAQRVAPDKKYLHNLAIVEDSAYYIRAREILESDSNKDRISLYLNRNLLHQIDKDRDKVNRSQYIEDLLKQLVEIK